MIKKMLYWLLMFVILVALNTSSIVWLVYNFVPSPQVHDLSMWDISILKNQLNLLPNEYLSVNEKGCVYLFMIVGIILSILFIKWLFVDTINQIREKTKEKKDKAYKRYRKELKNEG